MKDDTLARHREVARERRKMKASRTQKFSGLQTIQRFPLFFKFLLSKTLIVFLYILRKKFF